MGGWRKDICGLTKNARYPHQKSGRRRRAIDRAKKGEEHLLYGLGEGEDGEGGQRELFGGDRFDASFLKRDEDQPTNHHLLLLLLLLLLVLLHSTHAIFISVRNIFLLSSHRLLGPTRTISQYSVALAGPVASRTIISRFSDAPTQKKNLILFSPSPPKSDLIRSFHVAGRKKHRACSWGCG